MKIARWWRGLISRPVPLSTGEVGERRAEQFLEQLGFRILARNWRNPHDRREELDLVCRDREVVVFVEVKTRAAGALVAGYYTINRRKKDVLRRAADAYLKSLTPSQRPQTFRLDVVEIEMGLGPAGAQVRHFENVPLFPKYYLP